MQTPVRDRLASHWQSIKDEYEFSKLDPAWLKTAFDYALSNWHAVPYRPEHATFSMPDKCTVAVVGDWGTGTPEALKVMRGIATFNPDIFIHLGDVYYSGTKSEMQRRFLDPLKATLGQSARVFSLCGNHDVYSGGEGYYWMLDQIGQGSSHFTLESSNVQFLAVDTGHSDYDPLSQGGIISIHDAEAELVRSQIDDKKTIVLSHHQPFSAFSRTDTLLIEQLGIRMEAWLGAHEHRFAAYNSFRGVERYRCLGAGAVPELVTHDYWNGLQSPMVKNIKYGDDGLTYKHSFGIIALNNSDVSLRVFDEDLTPLFSEVF